MKQAYARVLLWLISPALRLSDERDATGSQQRLEQVLPAIRGQVRRSIDLRAAVTGGRDPDVPKLCKECRHFLEDNGACTHPELVERVHGTPGRAATARRRLPIASPPGCGDGGFFFEAAIDQLAR